MPLQRGEQPAFLLRDPAVIVTQGEQRRRLFDQAVQPLPHRCNPVEGDQRSLAPPRILARRIDEHRANMQRVVDAIKVAAEADAAAARVAGGERTGTRPPLSST